MRKLVRIDYFKKFLVGGGGWGKEGHCFEREQTCRMRNIKGVIVLAILFHTLKLFSIVLVRNEFQIM